VQKFKEFILGAAGFFKRTDKLLLILSMVASAYGMLMVYSATKHSLKAGAVMSSDVRTMLIAVILGIVISLALSVVDFEVYTRFWIWFAALGVLLMIIVMLFGVAPAARSDARTWLNLKIFYFQPSELVKICFIIVFTALLDRFKDELDKPKTVLILMAAAAVPILLVMKSGDDGSALVFILITLVMIFAAGINWKYILGAVALCAAAIPLVWLKMSEFQKERFLVIIKPDLYPDTAYQQDMSISAIGSGGFHGEGLFKGVYTQLGSVPESQNDMIFATIGEELGFVGCIFAVGILIAITARILRNGSRSGSFVGNLLCIGVAAEIAVQTIINVAMCLRLGPVIGITLPFFSAGGSSSLCLYIGLGLVFSVYRSTNDKQPVDYRLSTISSNYR
jgi:rod shape determining protein RodA